MPPVTKTPVDREAIKNGYFQKMAKEAEEQGLIKLTSQKEREVSWRSILNSNPNPCGSFWIFAYGSLLWNPAFRLVETLDARLEGYHRDFNLRTYIGRGCSKQPGLVLGLEEGGYCQGQILKIDPNHVEEELNVLWSREMLASAYIPHWLDVITNNGETLKAVAFVMDSNYMHYAGHMTFEEKCHDLAHGTGALGCAADYLFETVNALSNLGINDPFMTDCARRVKEIKGT
jgi:cation transport protein ChaC